MYTYTSCDWFLPAGKIPLWHEVWFVSSHYPSKTWHKLFKELGQAISVHLPFSLSMNTRFMAMPSPTITALACGEVSYNSEPTNSNFHFNIPKGMKVYPQISLIRYALHVPVWLITLQYDVCIVCSISNKVLECMFPR